MQFLYLLLVLNKVLNILSGLFAEVSLLREHGHCSLTRLYLPYPTEGEDPADKERRREISLVG